MMSSRFVPKQSQDWFVKESLSFRFHGNLTPPPPLCKWQPVSHPNWPRSPEMHVIDIPKKITTEGIWWKDKDIQKHEKCLKNQAMECISSWSWHWIILLLLYRFFWHFCSHERQNSSTFGTPKIGPGLFRTETPATVWTFPVDHHTPPKPQLQCYPSTQRSSCH